MVWKLIRKRLPVGPPLGRRSAVGKYMFREGLQDAEEREIGGKPRPSYRTLGVVRSSGVLRP